MEYAAGSPYDRMFRLARAPQLCCGPRCPQPPGAASRQLVSL
jgi:hypothetical protein